MIVTHPQVWGTLDNGEYYENFADAYIFRSEDNYEVFVRIYQENGGQLNYVWTAETEKSAKRAVKRLFKVFYITEYEWKEV